MFESGNTWTKGECVPVDEASNEGLRLMVSMSESEPYMSSSSNDLSLEEELDKELESMTGEAWVVQ